jgi:HEAT repeat protein
MEHVIPLINDADEFVRIYAVRALGEIADGSALEAIKRAREQASSDILFYYDDAIAAISARNTTDEES